MSAGRAGSSARDTGARGNHVIGDPRETYRADSAYAGVMTEDHIPYAEYAGDPDAPPHPATPPASLTQKDWQNIKQLVHDLEPEPRDPNRGIGLIERIFPLRSPQTEEIANKLDALRIYYKHTAERVVDLVPDEPDQTLIIRELHLNMQKAIMAVVCGEENVALMNAKERETESR